MNIFKKTVTLAAAVSLVCLSSAGAMAANKLIVKDSTGVTDKFVVTDAGWVGMGTSAPVTPIHIVAGGTSAATTIQMVNTGVLPYSAYNAPTFQSLRNNDATTNGGLPQVGDRLGYFAFGANFSGTTRFGAGLGAYAATSSGTSTSFPAYLTFETTTPGSTYPNERLRITQTGNIGIGTTSPVTKLDVNGGIRLGTTGGRPTCDATTRGLLWFLTNVNPNVLYICAENGGSPYWRIVTLQ